MAEPTNSGSNQVDSVRRHFNSRIGKYLYLGRSKSMYWSSKRKFRGI